MDERGTRKKLIDPLLEQAGWVVVPFKRAKDLWKYTHHAVEGFPTANGPADYALIDNGEFVGIVEAKKIEIGP